LRLAVVLKTAIPVNQCFPTETFDGPQKSCVIAHG